VKASFPGYYRPTDAEFDALWGECTFVLDTNVLLNLYRYSPSTASALLETLDAVSDRLWVPHQVAQEYFEGRVEVICKQRRQYDDAISRVAQLRKNLAQELEASKAHPFADPSVQAQVTGHLVEIEELLTACRRGHPDLLAGDTVLDRLTAILEGKVGPPPDQAIKDKVAEEGQRRYDSNVPPGYKDDRKPGNGAFGDLIMWFQVLARFAGSATPVVLVTDDAKDDWWWRPKEGGRTLGPRPELVAEFMDASGAPFYMYSTDRFMEEARRRCIGDAKQGAIDEARELRESLGREPALAPERCDARPQEELACRLARLNAVWQELDDAEGQLAVARHQQDALLELAVSGEARGASGLAGLLVEQNSRACAALEGRARRLRAEVAALEPEAQLLTAALGGPGAVAALLGARTPVLWPSRRAWSAAHPAPGAASASVTGGAGTPERQGDVQDTRSRDVSGATPPGGGDERRSDGGRRSPRPVSQRPTDGPPASAPDQRGASGQREPAPRRPREDR